MDVVKIDLGLLKAFCYGNDKYHNEAVKTLRGYMTLQSISNINHNVRQIRRAI